MGEREREGGAHLVLARACMQAEQRLPRPSYNKRNEQRSSSAGNNPTQPLHFQEKETERRERRREKRERDVLLGEEIRRMSSGVVSRVALPHVLECEYDKSVLRVRELEARKREFLMQLMLDDKEEQLQCEVMEKQIVQKVAESVQRMINLEEDEKKNVERKLVEAKEQIRNEREHKRNLYTIIQQQQQQQKQVTIQKTNVKDTCVSLKQHVPAARVTSVVEEEEVEEQFDIHVTEKTNPVSKKKTNRSNTTSNASSSHNHRSKLRQKVVPLSDINRSSPPAEVPPQRDDVVVDDGGEAKEEEEKSSEQKRPTSVDLSVPYEPPVEGQTNKKRSALVKKEAKPKNKSSAPGGGAGSAANMDSMKIMKRKFQGNGWSGTSCLSSLPTNLLFGENFKVPKLLKK